MERRIYNRSIAVVIARLRIAAAMLAVAACAPGVDPRPAPAVDAGHCGNRICDLDETASSCPQDCTCGNGTCETSETPTSCPQDCRTVPVPMPCGDGVCASGETPTSCPQDCHCGDGVCAPGETPTSCPQDCPGVTCGNGMCESGETPASCEQDCAATLLTVNNSSLTVANLYVYGCSSPTEGADQLRGKTIPPGSRFPLVGIPPGCYDFHAHASTGGDARTKNNVLSAALIFTWTLKDGAGLTFDSNFEAKPKSAAARLSEPGSTSDDFQP